MPHWIYTIANKDKSALYRVRLLTDWLVAENETGIWLKGEINQGVPLAIEQLPCTTRFRMDESNRLFPIGKLTPTGVLPLLKWHTLQDFLPVEMPVAALAGEGTKAIEVRLVRSAIERKSELLLVQWEEWEDYVREAPKVRLAPLRFATNAEGETLIWGEPLPPLPGTVFWQDHQVFLPAGWTFEQEVIAEILAETYCKDKSAFLLFRETGQWEKINWAHFVRASRPAIHQTKINQSLSK